jgi:hypothetical protein
MVNADGKSETISKCIFQHINAKYEEYCARRRRTEGN